ncbi:MAG: hypothetical protein GX567_10545 [Clostridia bacterium]|nr:hypothetical protein [Clostridia bacterium]
MDQKFQDFIMTVPAGEQSMVLELDTLFKQYGYECGIEEAKQGYVVSYFKKIGKKKVTIANFVFRKAGVLIRIYAANIAKYESLLNELPKKMKAGIARAGDCKRLHDPSTCNQRCQAGFTFHMDGVVYKKCRYMAFMPLLCEENDEFILRFVKAEILEASQLENLPGGSDSV